MKKTYNELKKELAELKFLETYKNTAPCDEYLKVTRNLIWGSIIILGLLILFAGLESLVDANRVQIIVITTRTISG